MKKTFLDQVRRALAVWWFGSAVGVVALLSVPAAAWATSVMPPEFPQLVNESDYIVRAVVKSITSEWRENQGRRHIFTFVELEVREVIAGQPPQPLILQMLGGKVGEDELVVAGAPRFKVGDEDVLFIQGNGRNISPLVAIMYGRYPVLREKGSGREYLARSNKVPLEDAAEVALPLADGAGAALQLKMKSPDRALTPAQFIQRIRLAVDPGYRRSRPR